MGRGTSDRGHDVSGPEPVPAERALLMLLKAGEPLAEALRLSATMSGASASHAEASEKAALALESGQRASTALAQSRAVPDLFVDLFHIGEESNRLDETLAAATEIFSAQADRTSERMLRLLTPVLTLVLGGVMGLVIYAVMGALLEVNSLAG